MRILHEDTAAKSLRDSGLVSSAILKDEGTSDDLYQGFNYMDRLEDDLVGGLAVAEADVYEGTGKSTMLSFA